MTKNDLQLVDADLTVGFTVDEVAASLHVCPRTIYRAVKSGDLKCFRVGRAVRITRDQLADYLRRIEING